MVELLTHHCCKPRVLSISCVYEPNKYDFYSFTNDEQIISGLKRITTRERKLQSLFLQYLVEVNRRKLFAQAGFSSRLLMSCERKSVREVESILGLTSLRAKRSNLIAQSQRAIRLLRFARNDDGAEALETLKSRRRYESVQAWVLDGGEF